MPTPEQMLTQLYADFNARNTEAVLAHMTEDVDWPSSTEGGRVTGPAAVGAYWARQWTTLNPHVDPLGFAQDNAGRTIVTVHQVVHDTQGHLLADLTLQHVYTLRNGRVRRMEIEPIP